jgi:hypothetical protein
VDQLAYYCFPGSLVVYSTSNPALIPAGAVVVSSPSDVGSSCQLVNVAGVSVPGRGITDVAVAPARSASVDVAGVQSAAPAVEVAGAQAAPANLVLPRTGNPEAVTQNTANQPLPVAGLLGLAALLLGMGWHKASARR